MIYHHEKVFTRTLRLIRNQSKHFRWRFKRIHAVWAWENIWPMFLEQYSEIKFVLPVEMIFQKRANKRVWLPTPFELYTGNMGGTSVLVDAAMANLKAPYILYMWDRSPNQRASSRMFLGRRIYVKNLEGLKLAFAHMKFSKALFLDSRRRLFWGFVQPHYYAPQEGK